MKLTMSRDGRPRVTLRIEHRIGPEELVVACILDLPHGEELTKNDIEDAVRDCLTRGGREIFGYWQDHMDEHDVQRLQDWATGQVHKHWPALFAPPTPPPDGLTPSL